MPLALPAPQWTEALGKLSPDIEQWLVVIVPLSWSLTSFLSSFAAAASTTSVRGSGWINLLLALDSHRLAGRQ